MKRLILIAGFALLAGCSEKGAVEEAVRDILNDPDSARFGEITIVDTAEGRKACATINAKNRMGGYTGDKQMTLFYDDDLQKWSVVNDWEFSHEMCIDIISDDEEGQDSASAAAAEAEKDDSATSEQGATTVEEALMANKP